jgi:hypothetical protein
VGFLVDDDDDDDDDDDEATGESDGVRVLLSLERRA